MVYATVFMTGCQVFVNVHHFVCVGFFFFYLVDTNLRACIFVVWHEFNATFTPTLSSLQMYSHLFDLLLNACYIHCLVWRFLLVAHRNTKENPHSSLYETLAASVLM